MQMRDQVLALFFVVVVVSALHAQAGGTQSLSFEVASVKRNTSGSLVANTTVEGNRYVATNLSVKDLMATAYAPLPRNRMVGGPSWINTDRFDIVATMEGTPTPPEIFAMVRSLLVDRFQLAAHSETRDGDVYDLLVTRSASELGPKLRPSERDCRVPPLHAAPYCGRSGLRDLPRAASRQTALGTARYRLPIRRSCR